MIIDLSHLIVDRMPVFPGDEETVLHQSRRFEKDYYNNHQLSINMHAGTHIDGPMHLTDSNVYLNELPLDNFIGEGCLLDVTGQSTIHYREEYERAIKPGQIVLLYTGHSRYFGDERYFTDYPVWTLDFAKLLIRKRVKMIGMDTPSPDKHPFDIHKTLFEHHIPIAENLTNLELLLHVKSFEVIALPLHIKSDSSPARVIARLS